MMDVTVTLNATRDGVEAVILLPSGITSPSDVSVEVIGDDSLLVQSADGSAAQVALPAPVEPDTGLVRFKRSSGKLTFTASLKSTATPNDPAIHDLTSAPPATTHPKPDAPSPMPEPVTGDALGKHPPVPASTICKSLTPNANSSASPNTNCKHSHPTSPSASLPPESAAAHFLVSPPPPPPAPHLPLPPPQPSATHPASPHATDDADLYAEFYCDSPPAMPPPPATSCRTTSCTTATPLVTPSASLPPASNGHPSPPSSVMTPSANGHSSPPTANAARVGEAFAPTDGTSGRTAGFSFTAPDLPPPPPLPPGLPPVAPPVDCRYLSVANALRLSAHAATATLAELMGVRRRPSAAAAARTAERKEAILQRVADTLDAYGYAVLDNYITEAAIQSVRQELKVMEPHYSPGLIWVGKEAESGAQIAVSSVRGDVVLWLDDPALNATAFLKDGVRRTCSFMQAQQMLADVDELVFEGLRPRLPYLAGLHRRSDAMMAVYPGKGARFAKHVDNTTGDGRRLTVLTYLNPGWQEGQGGALRLFPVREGAAPVVDVLPQAGRVALFLSAEVAHEVMPAFAPRHAVTLWYFDAGEHAASLTAAKVLPGATSRPTAQAAATALLRDLLADEANGGIQATEEGCTALGTRVASLEPGAKQLLAAVLGLPSTVALVESMQGLTPDSMRRRREELRNMGLGMQQHAPDTTAHV